LWPLSRLGPDRPNFAIPADGQFVVPRFGFRSFLTVLEPDVDEEGSCERIAGTGSDAAEVKAADFGGDGGFRGFGVVSEPYGYAVVAFRDEQCDQEWKK